MTNQAGLERKEKIQEAVAKMCLLNNNLMTLVGDYKNNDDPVGKLMHDFRCTSPVDMFYPLLAKQVKYFKETVGGQKVMDHSFEELAEEVGRELAKGWAEELAIELAEELAKKRTEELAKERVEELAKEKAEELIKERSEEKLLEEKKSSACRMIARGKLTMEEIAEDTDLPLEVVRDLAGLQMA